MDEEIKRTMEELSEGMRQLAESFGNQSKLINDQFEKDKKYASWEEEDQKRQKANSKDIREAEIKQLGYYRDELGIIRESVDLRKSENQQKKEAINQIKKDVGEEAFLRKQQQKLLSEELDKIEQNNSAYANMARTAARAAKAMESPGEAIKSYTTEHGRQLDSLNSIVGAGKDSLYDMAKGSKLATGGLVVLESVATLAAGALSGVMKASMAMGKELINGQRGMAVGAKGVTAFTHEVATATKTVGTALTALGAGIIGVAVLLAPFTGGLSLGALAIGGLAVAAGTAASVAATTAETLAELNEIAAQLNDKLFAGFNELGKMSMTAAGGMSDISDKLHKMGMTVAEFDKFKAVVAANSKEMKMFGSTMADGLTKFTDASAALYDSESSKMFQRMGITLDEQYEHTAKYMALQSRLGLLQDKNAKDVAKSTANYIEELDKIAAITGVTRKEQEDARNAVMAIEQLRAGILDEQRKADQGDTGAKARLEKMERALDVATQLQAQGLTKAAMGVGQYYGAGGRVTSLESAEARRNLGGTFRAIDEGKGSKTSRAMLAESEMVEAGKRYAGARRIQTGEGDMAGIISDKSASIGDLAAKTAKREKEQLDAERKLGRKFSDDERDKFFKDFEERALKDRKATDKTTADNVELVRNQQQAAIKLDEAAKKFTDSVGINKIASDTFAAAVKKFDDYFKGGSGSGTTGGATGATAPTYGTTGGGAAFGNPKLARQGQRAGASQSTPASMQSLQDAGLILKKGDVQQSGAGVDPRLIELAKQVQNIPGFKYFSAFNDGFHNEKSPSSSHTSGRAFDFVLDKKPSKEEGQKLVAMLQGMGIDYVQDEYNNPSSKATAGHIHAELKGARTGGVFDGPSSGYPVMLHGREAVVPQANFKDIKKETLSSGTTSPAGGQDEVVGLLADMVETMSEKLDQVINKLGDSNDIQGKILNYSMA
jgi:hypothetical protein